MRWRQQCPPHERRSAAAQRTAARQQDEAVSAALREVEATHAAATLAAVATAVEEERRRVASMGGPATTSEGDVVLAAVAAARAEAAAEQARAVEAAVAAAKAEAAAKLTIDPTDHDDATAVTVGRSESTSAAASGGAGGLFHGDAGAAGISPRAAPRSGRDGVDASGQEVSAWRLMFRSFVAFSMLAGVIATFVHLTPFDTVAEMVVGGTLGGLLVSWALIAIAVAWRPGMFQEATAVVWRRLARAFRFVFGAFIELRGFGLLGVAMAAELGSWRFDVNERNCGVFGFAAEAFIHLAVYMFVVGSHLMYVRRRSRGDVHVSLADSCICIVCCADDSESERSRSSPPEVDVERRGLLHSDDEDRRSLSRTTLNVVTPRRRKMDSPRAAAK